MHLRLQRRCAGNEVTRQKFTPPRSSAFIPKSVVWLLGLRDAADVGTTFAWLPNFIDSLKLSFINDVCAILMTRSVHFVWWWCLKLFKKTFNYITCIVRIIFWRFLKSKAFLLILCYLKLVAQEVALAPLVLGIRIPPPTSEWVLHALSVSNGFLLGTEVLLLPGVSKSPIENNWIGECLPCGSTHDAPYAAWDWNTNPCDADQDKQFQDRCIIWYGLTFTKDEFS